MLNIFSEEVFKSTFFSPLVSHNKELYSDFMDYLIKDLDNNVVFKIDRDRLRDLLRDFLIKNKERYEKEFILESEDKTSDLITNIINTYRENGWIDEEVDISGIRYIIVVPECIELFAWLNKIKLSNEQFLTSSVSGIRNNLLSENLDYALLKQVKNDTTQLNNNLKNLHVATKTMIKAFTKNKKLNSITDALIEGFNSRCFKDYQKLKTSENFKKYNNQINNKLYMLITDENSILTDITNKYIEDYESEAVDKKAIFEKTYNELMEIVKNISNFFTNDYEDIIRSIEFERQKYTQIAVEQIQILNQHDESQLAKIQLLINYCVKLDEDLSDVIFLPETELADINSIKESSKTENIKVIDYIKEDELTDIEKRIATEKIITDSESKYSLKKLENVLFAIMDGKDNLKISDVPINTKDDLTMLGLIPVNIYSLGKFSVEKLDDYYNTKYGVIKNYIIRRENK